MNIKKKVGIVGYGYVGKAVKKFFEEHYETFIYDPKLGFRDKNLINKADLAIICVPTPMKKNGEVDTKLVEETVSWIKTPLILIKSTIPPETTAKLTKKYRLEDKLVFSPEYIGEGNYPIPHWKGIPHGTDMKLHNFFVFGGKEGPRRKIIEFFKIVSGPHARYVQTTSTTAELLKYMENSWLAAKVTFSNEFYEIASIFGVDYNELRELFLLDGRMEPSHTLVFEEKRGYGGKCLPKDISGITKASTNKGYKPNLLEQIIKSNRIFLKNQTK